MKLQYIICVNLIRKTSGIISFDGMRETDYETIGYGWKQCTMKYQIVNNVTLKNLINCCINVFLTWERNQVIGNFKKTQIYTLLVFKTNF